jgi:hypothetical protein
MSAVEAGPPAGAVFWQLQLSVPNGFGWVLAGPGSALAGAAATIRAPKPIAVLTSTLAINRSRFVMDILSFHFGMGWFSG